MARLKSKRRYVAFLVSVQPKVPRHRPALRFDRDLEQILRIEDVHAVGYEGEVVHAAVGDRELSDEDAFGVPSTDRVSTSPR